MALISRGRLLLAAWDFRSAVWETLDRISPLESVKRLDLTPNDRSSFAGSPNGSVSGGLKIPFSLPVGVRGRGQRCPTRGFQGQLTVIIITTSAVAHYSPDTKLGAV